MQFLTDFADQAVILPSVAVLLCVLLLFGTWRGALAWAAVVVASFGLLLALKLAFGACGSPLANDQLRSPSGHTMAATVFYGGLLAVSGVRRRTVMIGAMAIAVLIGWSRLALHDHSLAEVLLGGAIGVAAVGVLVGLLGSTPQPFVGWPMRRRVLLTAALLIPALVLHSHRSHAESWIEYFARTRLRSMIGCHPAAAGLALAVNSRLPRFETAALSPMPGEPRRDRSRYRQSLARRPVRA